MRKKILTSLIALLIVHCTLNIEHCMCQWMQTNLSVQYGQYVGSMTSTGNDIFAGIWNKGVFRTSNNGSNWIYISNDSINSVTSVANNKDYIFYGVYGTGSNAIIYRSSNFGLNWVNVGNFIPYNLVSKIFTKGDTLLASVWNLKVDNLLDFRLYLSANNGNTWNSAGFYYNISDFTKSENYGFLATGYGVFISSNYSIWNKVNNGLTDTVATSITYDSQNNVLYTGTSHSGVFMSTNFGGNWIPKNNGISSLAVYSLKVLGNIAIAGTSSGVYISSNFGTNWIYNGLAGIEIKSLAFSNSFAFAGTSYNSIWRRPLSEIIGINRINSIISDKFSLFQNYPNPFNPVTIIKYQVASLKHINLVIYNILGKEIETLVNEKQSPGTYEVSWNATDYPSGVYYYKLSAGDPEASSGQVYSETKKMVLVK